MQRIAPTLLAACTAFWLSAAAAQPLDRVVTYDAHLLYDGEDVSGAVDMDIDMFSSQSDCESNNDVRYRDSQTVEVYAGEFSVVIPDVPDLLFQGTEIWLRLTVRSTPLVGCQQLGSVPGAIRSYGGVPLGTIIDWWRPDAGWSIPDGFQLCDGSAITDALSPFLGSHTPDLVGQQRFVRSVPLGELNFDGNLAAHTHNVDFAEVSDISPTSSVTTGFASSHDHELFLFDTDDNRWIYYSSSSRQTYVSSSGQNHNMNGSDDVPLARRSSHADLTITSGSGGGHSHSTTLNLSTNIDVGNTTSSTGGDTYPQWYGLAPLMRIY